MRAFRSRYRLHAVTLAGIGLLMSGCGGPDFTSGGNSSSFNSGLTGNYSGFGGGGGTSAGGRQTTPLRGRGVYPHVEASFELPDVKGNPFDYTENDVQVSFSTPDNHTRKVPAFFDGGKMWRVRFTPEVVGRFAITGVTLNGETVQPEKLDKREFDVNGSPLPGFVHVDPRDHTRFILDNGNTYYPLGNNEAWNSSQAGGITGALEKMGRAGENWSRIWMDHWDGKNLDWVADQKVAPGTLSLEVAKKWDAIVDAAEKSGIYFQMVLQHHGQYSTRVNPNWAENPWNKKNGGWLSTPDEFFTDPRAIALTKAKYRYIIARWGYSPSILAYELFNEVQYTDAMAHKHADEVAAWHNMMAAFIREQDPNKHLITTSSDIDVAALWPSMDYIQTHAYPSDPLTTNLVDARKLNKPIFLGEFGPGGKVEDYGAWIHRALWAGLMSEASGAPEMWDWELIDKDDLYGQFRAAGDFLKQSGLISRRGLLPASATVETPSRGAVAFGPGAGWASAKQTEFEVPPSGAVPGLAGLPAFFQGSAHRDMFGGATFKVDYPEPGTFRVSVRQVSAQGGKLVVSVDGNVAASRDFPGKGEDTDVDETVEAKVPAGRHEVRVENTGADWVVVKEIALEPYGPALQALGRADKDFAAVWLLNRSGKETTGKLTVSGLQAGSYKAAWWDTSAGKLVSDEPITVSGASPLTLTVPAVQRDIAVYVNKAGQKTAAKSRPSKRKHT